MRVSEMRIAVLAGGSSSEREISLASGQNATRALQTAGFGYVELLDTAATDFVARITTEHWDTAFLALHGAGGEDGIIQGFLEFIGLPYTGSDVAASVACADKDLAKLLYSKAGIPTPPSVAIVKDESYDVETIILNLGDQCFVKPADNGSSYGITLVKDGRYLDAAIRKAFEYGDKVLVEKRVCGTEVTVGVLDTGDLRALPVVEVCCENEGAEFYDLNVKYIDPAKIHRIPAEISEENNLMVQGLACRAHRALGCSGLSRSDFIVTDDGPVILETNSIPGMTDASLFPDEIAHTGDLTFPEACAQLIHAARRRAGL
ncbi:D-alanine--D-alanine ligase [Collinsella sp. AGMB00827]|uniref:D-alanine--D-alanine ligase n=1 Tax=Collinsella ureilytica TaxID=2869515 RepID=A0ABS7MKL6_9ACTN|nr:D-alanine--D-alanine ligase [Collinsella urealyticum]MBY4797812.1 D-alanine--D-alanine ligase [Collinsella urealyticum]